MTYYGSTAMWWAGGVLYWSYSWLRVETYSHSEWRSCMATWWRASVQEAECLRFVLMMRLWRYRNECNCDVVWWCTVTCAFTQTCLQSLQETVQEQFPSGDSGRTRAHSLWWFCCINAAQQWTEGNMCVCSSTDITDTTEDSNQRNEYLFYHRPFWDSSIFKELYYSNHSHQNIVVMEEIVLQ